MRMLQRCCCPRHLGAVFRLWPELGRAAQGFDVGTDDARTAGAALAAPDARAASFALAAHDAGRTAHHAQEHDAGRAQEPQTSFCDRPFAA